jgi:hypothetical protein
VAKKLPGLRPINDQEASNGHGFLSMREIRLERLKSVFSACPSDGVNPRP